MKWFAIYKVGRFIFFLDITEKNPENLQEARKYVLEYLESKYGEEAKLIGVYSECITPSRKDEWEEKEEK